MKIRPDGSQEYGAAEQLEKMMSRTAKKFIKEAAAQHAEQARRLSRYDDAIRLLRECTEWAGRVQIPGIDWWDVQIDEGTMEEALAFLAAEPKEER